MFVEFHQNTLAAKFLSGKWEESEEVEELDEVEEV
jgi:hypothetical protein